jgi:3-methyladenine DNA glycosylase AlkD
MSNRMNYIQELQKIFADNGNSDNAYQMSKYLKFKFEFHGIKKPERSVIQKSFLNKAKKESIDKIFDIIYTAFETEYRELHYFGIDLLRKSIKKLRESDIENLEKLLQTHSWWDSVDSIAMAVGDYFKLYPKNKEIIINPWINSENMWLNRVVIIFQLKYKTETNLKLLTKAINSLKHKDEFFIQKAIGWSLREYSKTNPDWVIRFVEQNNIKSLAKREALKKIKD